MTCATQLVKDSNSLPFYIYHVLNYGVKKKSYLCDLSIRLVLRSLLLSFRRLCDSA